MVAVHSATRTLADRLKALDSYGALSDQIYDILGEAIVEGHFPAGERLSDKALAQELRVSRTPVREALQRLSRIGLVEVSPSRFTRVTEVSEAAVATTLEYTGLQAGVALQLAMGRMGPAELEKAIELLDAVIDASDRDDSRDLMLAARLFVGYLTRQGGNDILARMMHEASLLLERNLRQGQVLLGDSTFRADCYQRMREAMLAGDADAAERWFRRLHGIRSLAVPAV